MARVALVADWWWPEVVGGAERSAREAALTLAGRGHDVVVLVPGEGDGVRRDGPVRVRSVQLGVVESTSAIVTAARGRRLAAAMLDGLREEAPDAVLLFNTWRLGLTPIRAVRASLPTAAVVHVHSDPGSTCWRRSLYRDGAACGGLCASCRVRAWLETRAHVGVDRCVFASRMLRDVTVAAGVVPADRAEVGSPLAPPAMPAVEARSISPVVRGRTAVVGYLGRLVDEKGLRPLIAAVGLLVREGRDVRLLIAGAGGPEYVRGLRRQAVAAGVEAELAGVLDPADFARRVDLAVVPTVSPEPFGRVPVELAALGVRSLVSPLGGLPEAASMCHGLAAVLSGLSPTAIAHDIGAVLDGRWPSSPTRVADLADGADMIDVAYVVTLEDRLVALVEGPRG